LTLAHTAPFSALAGKTVALEPATAISFDTPLLSRSPWASRRTTPSRTCSGTSSI